MGESEWLPPVGAKQHPESKRIKLTTKIATAARSSQNFFSAGRFPVVRLRPFPSSAENRSLAHRTRGAASEKEAAGDRRCDLPRRVAPSQRSSGRGFNRTQMAKAQIHRGVVCLKNQRSG